LKAKGYEAFLFEKLKNYRYVSPPETDFTTRFPLINTLGCTLIRTTENNRKELFDLNKFEEGDTTTKLAGIFQIIKEVAGLDESCIPRLKAEKRISRSKLDGKVLQFIQSVYAGGYEDETNPGSTLLDGGQEQRLTMQSAINFSIKLYTLLNANTNLTMKWVSPPNVL